ncbi:RNA-directed DNA polymerase from mobile element jockey [Trichonephila clavipes]|nr:RNA-directed DNA polymerase from mobile element jockey [Trichonephila clavipes]
MFTRLGARKLTNARPNDPKLQEYHQEVTKAGERVNLLLSQLDVPLFRIPASEKELDKILIRLKKQADRSPCCEEPESKTAAVPPSPPRLSPKARSPRSSPPPSPTPPSATSVEDARLEGEEEEMDSSQPAELQDQVVVPEVIKKPRIPPFFVSPKGDWRQLVALAKLIAPSFQSQMSGRFLKVTVGDELEYRNLSHWLEQSGVEFKSFMLKQDRPIKVVIRGLPSNTEPEDIKNEIEAEGFKVAKISQMKNYRSKAPMPLFYLQIENGVEALKIYDFTELFGTRIEVKPFERGNKVNQCWRCQGWFHSSEVCHLPPRCVKCAGPHSAKDCTLDFNDQMKCANCSGAHAANWSRCPKHPNNAKKKSQNKNKINGPNKPKNVPSKKNYTSGPTPDISKARKVSPSLDYSKVVQNQIPREHPFRSIPPLKGALGSTAITPIEKAEVIADSLQEQFEPNHVADREVFDQRIHEEVANFLATPHVQEIEPTTPTEVLTYVQRIKPKKSPGLDQISNRMLKNLPLKFLLFITFLINQLFKNNYFPDSWKTAVVIPILKPDKNPELAQNYRPISLLSCLSKVYEFVLMQRLNQHCAAVNFIIPQQCGFRPKCSTVHQLLRVTELIHSGFAKHEATGILFLDIAKAFDKIWHDGLLIKLIRLDFPAPLIKSIHSFLSHRSFRVRVDRILSSPRPIRSGLPQGSLSSPLLFTLYVNDIPQTDSSHLAMFADDTAVISQNKRFSVVISNLQHYVSSLELWLNDWKIKVNASKSACLMFTRRSRLPVGLTPVTIFGQPVPWVNVAKYLGLFLDAKLTFAYHIEQTRKKALAVHAMLKRLISRRSKLAIRHKVLLYKSIIRPVMCYGSQIFGSAGMCHLKKLHTLTNSFLRQIVNAPWFIRNEVIYRDLKIKPFLPHIKDLSKKVLR